MHYKSLSDLFDTQDAHNAQKALDYLDGKQLQHVISMLDDPNSGRKQWRKRGMKATYRNILGMIVNKSGMIFKDGSPKLELLSDSDINEKQSELLMQVLNTVDFNEFMINFDTVVRLLKTGILLTQFNDETNEMMFDILHRGNAIIRHDPISRKLYELIYKTSDDDDGEYCYYRIITPLYISDYKESNRADGGVPELINEVDNPYGKIPASVFYDTNIPRTGFWNHQPQDLVVLNEMYNLNLVDLEFASSWSVHQTLYTNCTIQSETAGNLEVSEVYGSVLPRQSEASSDELIGGLSRVITLDSTGVDSPFVEYKGPNLDLDMPAKLFAGWVKDYAQDWSVRVKVDGSGKANSGFQLIVEEMDNLELRQQRSRMMEAGIKRLYKCISAVWNAHNATKFVEDLELTVSFADPKLPVDTKSVEEVWSIKIREGRASKVDYLMEVKGLNKEEALLKLQEIEEINTITGKNGEETKE